MGSRESEKSVALTEEEENSFSKQYSKHFRHAEGSVNVKVLREGTEIVNAYQDNEYKKRLSEKQTFVKRF